jgi:hypothetical protein
MRCRENPKDFEEIPWIKNSFPEPAGRVVPGFPDFRAGFTPGKGRRHGDLLSQATGVCAAIVQIPGRRTAAIARFFQWFE